VANPSAWGKEKHVKIGGRGNPLGSRRGHRKEFFGVKCRAAVQCLKGRCSEESHVGRGGTDGRRDKGEIGGTVDRQKRNQKDVPSADSSEAFFTPPGAPPRLSEGPEPIKKRVFPSREKGVRQSSIAANGVRRGGGHHVQGRRLFLASKFWQKKVGKIVKAQQMDQTEISRAR